MRVASCLFLCAFSAAARAEPAVYDLPVAKVRVESERVHIDGFSVAAGSPIVEAKLNYQIALDAGLLGAGTAAGPPDREKSTFSSTCEVGVATSRFLSYRCSSLGQRFARAYAISGQEVREVAIRELFVERADLRAKLSAFDSILPIDASTGFFVTREGITFFGGRLEGWGIPHSTAQLAPFLAPGNPLERIKGSAPWLDAAGLHALRGEPRFTATGKGTVLDRATGLEWQDHDNGVDTQGYLPERELKALGGDWRLPTIEELEGLSAAGEHQRPTDDCAKGKYQYRMTPLIKLSCGLVWSSSGPSGSQWSQAFGFVTGKSRWSKSSDYKNLRLLFVRRAELAILPPTLRPTRDPQAVGLDWVPVPAGSFQMGAMENGCDHRKVRKAEVRAFSMARTETTVAAYQRCVDVLACEPVTIPRDFPTMDVSAFSVATGPREPINFVTWEQADTFCRWAGGRLATEAEWEYAARGSDGRQYPWGKAPPGPAAKNVANLGDVAAAKLIGTKGGGYRWLSDYDDGHGALAPVGSFPAGRSPFGLDDLAGNVEEWVSDLDHDGRNHIYRGSSFLSGRPEEQPVTSRCSVSGPPSRGFRCVKQ